MHIISRKMIRNFCEIHPEAQTAMDRWYQLVKKTDFESFTALKRLFSSADQVQNFIIFNVGGNKYRIITFIKYPAKQIYIRYILTHKEYDKEKWKKDLWYHNMRN